MQTKLTLRLEDSLIRKAKFLAKRRGTSVSRIFGEFIEKEENIKREFPPITSSMVGVIKRKSTEDIEEKDYLNHLESKYL